MDKNLKTIGIGTKEAIKLTPKKCIVESVEDKFVEKAKATKAVFHLKHPDQAETIAVSSVFLSRRKKDKEEITNFATWYNLDSEDKIQKNCPLAMLLKYYNVSNALEMIGKEVETKEESSGYLAIKAY